jgi:uncharacterized protein YbjT (DUF2867 family)
MILITGATSVIGKETARLLAEAGSTVRCMTRHPESAPAIEGATWVCADFARPDTLRQALQGVHSCLLLSATGEQQVELEGNFIEAAGRAGVQHLVKISALAAGSDALFASGRSHGEIESRVERSGIPFTHVQPHFFMQNFLRYAELIRGAGKFVASMGTGRMSLVDALDVAAVSAALLRGGPVQERRIAVTGPRALSFGDIAGLMSDVLGRRIDYVDVPESILRQNLTQLGRPPWVVDNVLGLQATFRTGAWQQTTRAVETLAGRKANCFEAFFQRHIDCFQ